MERELKNGVELRFTNPTYTWVKSARPRGVSKEY